jgi:hypothetical protein
MERLQCWTQTAREQYWPLKARVFNSPGSTRPMSPKRTLRAIRNSERYLFTHPEMREAVRKRFAAIETQWTRLRPVRSGLSGLSDGFAVRPGFMTFLYWAPFLHGASFRKGRAHGRKLCWAVHLPYRLMAIKWRAANPRVQFR